MLRDNLTLAIERMVNTTYLRELEAAAAADNINTTQANRVCGTDDDNMTHAVKPWYYYRNDAINDSAGRYRSVVSLAQRYTLQRNNSIDCAYCGIFNTDSYACH